MTARTLGMPPQTVLIVGAAAFAAIGAIAAYRFWRSARVTPEERERQRRAVLAARGKISDATIVEIRDDVLFYSYLVRGVEYTASQDVSGVKSLIPEGIVLGIGPIYVKYHPKNPANSIVLAEQWSGLHPAQGRQAQ